MYRKRPVFIAACLGMLLFGLVFLSLGTVSVFIQENLRVDVSGMASLASFLPVGILAGSLLFGPVVDRYGFKIPLIISAGLIVIAFEMIAFAQSLRLLQLSFFLIGLGGGVINGGTNALAADITTEGKGAKLSLLGVFYGAGALGMPLLIGILSRYFSYATIISLIGFFVLLPVLYFIVIQFPEPKLKQGFPITEAFSMIKQPVLILCGFILFFESALEGVTGNWVTTYLKSINLSAENALYILSCQVAAIAVARLLLSRLLRKVTATIVMYLSFACMLTGAILLSTASSFLMAMLSMLCLGTGFAAGFPVILGYIGELYAGMSGTAFSLTIVMALIGNTLLNLVVGIVTETWGIRHFPVIIIICAVFMVLLYSIVIKRISKKIKV